MKQRGIALIICLAVVVAFACNNGATEERRKQREVQAEDQRTKQAIGKLAEAHNAVLHWRQGLSGKEPIGRIYSAELAPILVRPDGRPLLFIGDVLDVGSTGKDYVCSFLADVNASRKARLILECTPEQATQIMRGPEGRYAVVARITSLGSAVPEPGADDYQGGAVCFPAYGTCVGQINLGMYYFDDLLELNSFPGGKDQP